jgi:hypothetical protein
MGRISFKWGVLTFGNLVFYILWIKFWTFALHFRVLQSHLVGNRTWTLRVVHLGFESRLDLFLSLLLRLGVFIACSLAFQRAFSSDSGPVNCVWGGNGRSDYFRVHLVDEVNLIVLLLYCRRDCSENWIRCGNLSLSSLSCHGWLSHSLGSYSLLPLRFLNLNLLLFPHLVSLEDLKLLPQPT